MKNNLDFTAVDVPFDCASCNHDRARCNGVSEISERLFYFLNILHFHKLKKQAIRIATEVDNEVTTNTHLDEVVFCS